MPTQPQKLMLFPSRLNTKKACPKNGGTAPCFCHPKMPLQTPKVARSPRPLDSDKVARGHY